MKIRKRAFFITLIMMLMFLLTSFGCGKREDNTAAERAGKYELTGIVSKGSQTEAEDIKLLNDTGMTCALILNEDGSGTLDLFGEEKALTWNEETITVDGKAYSYTYKDGTLVVIRGDSSLTFSSVARQEGHQEE